MSVETIDKISQWLTLLTLIAALVGTFLIVGTAAIQSLRNRVVRWDMLLYVLVILWSLPWGIRNYGPELTDASIDLMLSLAEKRPAMESAIREFIGNDVATDGGSNVTVPTAVFTSTPLPTMENQTDFDATATAYFGDFPTALPAQSTATPIPTATPRPMIEPTWTDYQHQTNGTPEPTVFLCRTVEDVAAGCVPATSTPGN